MSVRLFPFESIEQTTLSNVSGPKPLRAWIEQGTNNLSDCWDWGFHHWCSWFSSSWCQEASGKRIPNSLGISTLMYFNEALCEDKKSAHSNWRKRYGSYLTQLQEKKGPGKRTLRKEGLNSQRMRSVLYCAVLSRSVCLILCDPMDYSPPGCSVDGILQARILEWSAISYSRRASQSRDQTQVSRIAGRFFTDWTTWAAFDEKLVDQTKIHSLSKTWNTKQVVSAMDPSCEVRNDEKWAWEGE